MQVEIKVVIPSAGRAGTITTHKYINNCIVCVPDSQVKQYEEQLPMIEIIGHPDSVIGMGNKRNWIHQHFGNVFMVDDDTKGLNRVYQKKCVKPTPDQSYDIIQACGNVAAMMGCYLFGFNMIPNPLGYKGHKPVKLTGFVNGAAIGLLSGSVLKFSNEIKCNNDVYISLYNAFYYRKCYLDQRFSIIQNSVGKNTGGMSVIRTQEAEDQDIQVLKRDFGEAIKVVRRENSAKKYNLSFNLPF